jgi:hypothetical protein
MRCGVDADDFARGTHELGGEERDVTGTASDVEDSHPGADARGTEKALGDGAKQSRLLLETPVLLRRAPQGIGWIFGGHCKRSFSGSQFRTIWISVRGSASSRIIRKRFPSGETSKPELGARSK